MQYGLVQIKTSSCCICSTPASLCIMLYVSPCSLRLQALHIVATHDSSTYSYSNLLQHLNLMQNCTVFHMSSPVVQVGC